MKHWPMLFIVGGLLLACERPPPPPPPVDETPPDGSAHYIDADGIARTLLTPIATLRYGERVEDALPPVDALSGYEFAGNSGDRPTIILDVQGQARVSLALYGPRDDSGLWGRPLQATSGEGVLRISEAELPADGHYFILVRLLVGGPANQALALDCPDCDDGICPAVEPCDLYCDQGYAIADDGCRSCGCQEDAVCEGDGDCLTGEECRDGVCRPAASCAERCADEPIEPVCDGQGRTWPNRCVADCEGAEDIEPGACAAEQCGPAMPCPDGQACRAGRCVCDCPDEVAPVCAESGRTFSNLCQLQCVGETLAYEGPCDGPPLTTACEGDETCPQGQVCAGGGEGPGICTVECRPERGCNRAICTPLDGRFVCLPPCGPGDRCFEGLQCLPDPRGVSLCLPCDCPDVDEPVCADDRITYPSRCAARCAGVEDGRLTDGPCENGPVEIDCRRCPREWAPVCGDGVLRATLCDAECGGRPAERVAEAEACYERPPMLACDVDADCMLTGALRTVCAAAPSDAAPQLGPEARCFVREEGCGCIAGTCGFRPVSRDIDRCLERARQPRF